MQITPESLQALLLRRHNLLIPLFGDLRYIVIDEIHAYRGVFGSNLANVLRRLMRLCRFYGSNPQFICCSATIHNPKELAENMTARSMTMIDDNGAPAGIRTCVERGECLRQKMGIPSGQRHELCYAVHAEQNAIIQAAKLGINISGATLYCTHQPCILCAKMIVNAGIVRVVYGEGYPDEFALEILEEAGVRVERYRK